MSQSLFSHIALEKGNPFCRPPIEVPRIYNITNEYAIQDELLKSRVVTHFLPVYSISDGAFSYLSA